MMLTPRALISSALALFVAVCGAAAAPRATEPDPAGELVILPERTVLRGQGARQQLLIERRARRQLRRIACRGRDLLVLQSQPWPTVDESGVVTAVGDGRAILTAKAGERSISTVIEVERASATVPRELPQSRGAGAHEGRLQLRPLPRRGGRKERVQADAAGIRPRARLSDADAAGERAAHQQGRSGDQPDAAEADGGRLARRRQTLLAALTRVSRDCGLDRVRHACAGGVGSGDDAPGSVSRVRATGRRHRAAAPGPRALLGRARRGCHALGEVLDQRGRGCRRRSAGSRDGERAWRSGHLGVVSEPPGDARGSRLPSRTASIPPSMRAPRAPTSSTTWCWQSSRS